VIPYHEIASLDERYIELIRNTLEEKAGFGFIIK